MSINCARNKMLLYSKVLLRPCCNKIKWEQYHGKVVTPPNKYLTIYRDFHGPIEDDVAAKDFLAAVDSKERALLLQTLLHFEGDEDNDTVIEPTRSQLRMVLLHNTLPFIGFGFLDNFLMIVAGEYIDTMFGAMLGISTMAAAGFGNMISDVAGVGSASYVETLTAKFGVKAPPLSPQQVFMKKTRRYSNLGKVIGVTIGCIIGMFPLLFFGKDRREECDKHEEVKGVDKYTQTETKK